MRPKGTETCFVSGIIPYSYDAARNRRRTTDPLGNITTTLYDTANRDELLSNLVF